jgi:hypothetical protein
MVCRPTCAAPCGVSWRCVVLCCVLCWVVCGGCTFGGTAAHAYGQLARAGGAAPHVEWLEGAWPEHHALPQHVMCSSQPRSRGMHCSAYPAPAGRRRNAGSATRAGAARPPAHHAGHHTVQRLDGDAGAGGGHGLRRLHGCLERLLVGRALARLLVQHRLRHLGRNSGAQRSTCSRWWPPGPAAAARPGCGGARPGKGSAHARLELDNPAARLRLLHRWPVLTARRGE